MSTKGEFVTYPVGQGLFYAGKLIKGYKEFNFIYDCGSRQKEPLIKCITEYKSSFVSTKTKEIDMLVISHFDMDHVIGLKDLAKYFIIKRIFLPYLKNININLLSYALETLRHYKVISRWTKVILISGPKDDNSKNNDLVLPSLDKLESEAYKSTKSGWRLRKLIKPFDILVFDKTHFTVFD
ncbi:MBL fold metallo-hydrolase [Priestia megaterium]|uniref:MBL fold metallo-hydrolase n=1 Tax=Priestia megaterium TaxID=1404 RepID=UPI00263B7C33|nr:MBL fold metallo-hydrolase [Priestia megaterium]MDN4862799.1 hypothetical protein [Priestia megaterium]